MVCMVDFRTVSGSKVTVGLYIYAYAEMVFKKSLYGSHEVIISRPCKIEVCHTVGIRLKLVSDRWTYC